MIRHTSARCLLLILLWPATGSAQTGSIRGSVVDQTDLVLPGATVTLRGNGVPRTAYSDEQGNFELAGVAPGTYTLRVSLAGFSDATVEDVTVSGAPLELSPVALQLASFGDTVVLFGACVLALAGAGLTTGSASAQPASGFYLSQEIGLNVAPAVALLGNSTDRASRCDEFINPRFAEVPGAPIRTAGPARGGRPPTIAPPASWRDCRPATGSVGDCASRWNGSIGSRRTIRPRR